MNSEEHQKLEKDAIKIANKFGLGRYWKWILKVFVKDKLLGEKITKDKNWK